MRRSASVCTTAPSECENRWASVVDGPHRLHFLGQPEVKADSATSLLARGVKRRLLGGVLPGFDSNGVKLCSETLRNDPAAYKASKGQQTADDLDSFSRSHTGQRVGPSVHAEQHCQTVRWPDKHTIPASIPRPSHWQRLEESDADVAVDVDCCGDSGSASKLSSRASGVSAYAGCKFLNRLSSRNAGRPLPTLPEQDRSLARPMGRSLAPAKQQQDESSSLPMAITPRMPKASSELSSTEASTEMAFRLNHARQTVAFVQRQAASFSQLNKAKLGVWEALQHLNSVNEHKVYQRGAADQPQMSLFDHAVQTAELCRLAHPQQDWLHLVGLIHGLGKLMALPRAYQILLSCATKLHDQLAAYLATAVCSFGAQPDWAVFSESFPVGCRFSSSIPCSQFFSVNPDRRRRLYNSSTGMYKPGCGLLDVYMSWTAYEYLYLILIKNKTVLPTVARFVLRHCNFLALMRPGNAYTELLSGTDSAMMPWLRKFQAIQQAPLQQVEGRLEGQELCRYYDSLSIKYFPDGRLQF